ncbi:MAG: AMP-binding protein, partial [Salinigranum sp.]
MIGRHPRTLPALFERALAKYADRPAVRDDDGALTYRELDRRSARLARALADLGVGLEDRVGVLLGNRPAGVVVDVAVMRAGGARLPLNPQLTAADLSYLLGDAGAETLVCDAERLSTVEALDVEALGTVIVVGADDDRPLSDLPVECHRYEALLGADRPGAALPTPDAGDVAGHFYTGGTTGRPKGVRYTHECLVENLLAHHLEFGFSGSDVGLVATPLSHSGGTFCWAALLGGGTVVLQDGFDPETLAAAVERAGVTWTFLVPTMLYRLLDADAFAAVDHSSLDRVIYGAAPIRTDKLWEAIQRIGPVFHQFYGQTEVPNLITTFPPREHARALEADDDDRLASAGTPCLRATVEVRDRETGEVLPPGDVG